MDPSARMHEFVRYVRTNLRGDEKGEAHLFCDRLFRAFGHPGIKEAGGDLEFRVHQSHAVKFADLVWRPRLLLEMKKRGEKLQKHYRQAFEYWLHLVPNRPKYVILCNFDDFWVYNSGGGTSRANDFAGPPARAVLCARPESAVP